MSQSQAASPEWTVVEKFQYRKLIFLLESEGPAQDFANRLRVQTPGKKEFDFQSDGWVPIKSALLKDDPNYSRIGFVGSHFILGFPKTTNPKGSLLLILMGDAVASSPGRFDAFSVSPSGDVALLLRKRESALERVADLDGDGVKEIVLLPCFHQAVDRDLATYDPFLVYKIGARGKAVLSLPLSKQYNLQHYAGWAGPDCSEELFVRQLPHGKSKIVRMKAK